MTRKILMTSAAMFITAIGLSIAIQADIGLNPWWTLTSGISQKFHISLGMIVRLMSVLMILMALRLGKKPGIATFLDMLLIGFYMDIINRLPWPQLHNVPVRILVSFLGIIIFCLGITLTIRIGLGAGPKDTFTMALQIKLKCSFGCSKLIVDTSSFIIGFLLGGPIGVGTVMATLMPGFIIERLQNSMNTHAHAS